MINSPTESDKRLINLLKNVGYELKTNPLGWFWVDGINGSMVSSGYYDSATDALSMALNNYLSDGRHSFSE